MEEIEFSYKGINTTIKCERNDSFGKIIEKLFKKIEINLNSVNFLYSGSQIQNKEKSLNEIANDIDKERKKMNIRKEILIR